MWTVTYEQTFDIIFVTGLLIVILTGLLGDYRFESLKRAFEKSQQWIRDELDRWSDTGQQNFSRETQQTLEIWEKLIQVRNMGLNLMAASVAIATDEYHKIQKEIYFDMFFNSWRELRDVMKKNQPFFDPEVYAKLDFLIGDKLINDRDRSIEFTPQFIEETESVTKKIILGLDEVCESMKKEMDHGVVNPRINLN
jgi:hypothetical protein